jgi:hypothetical protein
MRKRPYSPELETSEKASLFAVLPLAANGRFSERILMQWNAAFEPTRAGGRSDRPSARLDT